MDLLISSVETISESLTDKDTPRVGLVDNVTDSELLETLLSQTDAKCLCVIRDPRDTASCRRIADEGEAQAWALRWNEHLQFVAKMNREFPSRFELIRYEDLAAGAAVKALTRLCRLLEMGSTVGAVRSPGEIDTGKPLSSGVATVIQLTSAEFLGKLQYLP